MTSADRIRYNPLVMFLPRTVYTGGERYLAEIATYMRRRGVPIEPIYRERSSERRRGLHLMMECLLANVRLFRYARRLGTLSGRVLFQGFHLHPRLWLFNVLVRLTSGRPRTVVLMQLALVYHTALKHRWARWLDAFTVRIFLRQASLILTNSEFTRQEVLSLGIDPSKVNVIHCGHEGIREPASKERRIFEEERPRILFVGQCAEYKGVEFLLRAMAMLSHRGAALDMVGNTAAEPEYFIRLKSIYETLGLQDRVTFHGHMADREALAGFYRRADLFVLPSLVEGFGIVLLDAMSFGLPIVATRAGAIPELVKENVNGLLVPAADPAALAGAIDRMLDAPIVRAQYGQAGYRFIQDHHEFYSWEAVGERAFRLMRPLLEETHP